MEVAVDEVTDLRDHVPVGEDTDHRDERHQRSGEQTGRVGSLRALDKQHHRDAHGDDEEDDCENQAHRGRVVLVALLVQEGRAYGRHKHGSDQERSHLGRLRLHPRQHQRDVGDDERHHDAEVHNVPQRVERHHNGDDGEKQTRDERVLEQVALGVHLSEDARQESVAGKSVVETRLGQETDERHYGHRHHLTSAHDGASPLPAVTFKSITETASVEVVHHAGQHERAQRAQHHRADHDGHDGNGHDLLGVLGLAGEAANFIKANVAEECLRGAGDDTLRSEGHGAVQFGACRNKRRQVVGVHGSEAGDDDEGNDAHLDNGDGVHESFAESNAHQQHHHAQELDEATAQVSGLQVEPVETLVRVLDQQPLLDLVAPATRHTSTGHGVLERQQPSGDDGGEFSNRVVGVRVRTARGRHARRQLHVSQRIETANDTANKPAHHRGGAGSLRDDRPGGGEDAAADSSADSDTAKVKKV
ncbi:hypothetical protein ON010_g16570 [Phytophthora cinnamomi]|nr:hypothetical protein ON010_g16570 [Phytophthora cinnamomi]